MQYLPEVGQMSVRGGYWQLTPTLGDDPANISGKDISFWRWLGRYTPRGERTDFAYDETRDPGKEGIVDDFKIKFALRAMHESE